MSRYLKFRFFMALPRAWRILITPGFSLIKLTSFILQARGYSSFSFMVISLSMVEIRCYFMLIPYDFVSSWLISLSH
jgi:hypothetical protein